MPLNLSQVDPSIIQTKQILPNFEQIPQGIKNLMDIQKSNIEIEKNRQSLLANQAVSKAIKDNTNESGDLDVPSIITQLSKDENASYNLPDIATKLLQLKGQQFTTDTAKLTNLATKNTLIGQRLGPMVNDIDNGKTVTRDQLINEMAHMVRIGALTPSEAAQHIDLLPPSSKDATQESANIGNFIKNEYLATQNNETLFNKLLPTTQFVSTGGGVQAVNISPMTGTVKPSAFIPGQLPPTTELIARAGDGTGLPPGTKYFLGSGGQPTVVPFGSQQPLVSGLSPQETANLEVGNKLVNDARSAAKNVQQGQFNANQIIRLADETNTGTGAKILREMGGGFAELPWTSDEATNFDKLGHILAQQTQTIAQSPGINGTNAGQQLASDVSGTTNWTKKAIKDTSRINRAMFEATQLFSNGVNNAYKSKDPEKAIQFQNKWNNALNIDTLRLLDAFKNKTQDPTGYDEVVKELGGRKSEKFIKAAKHLDVINDLIEKGE